MLRTFRHLWVWADPQVNRTVRRRPGGWKQRQFLRINHRPAHGSDWSYTDRSKMGRTPCGFGLPRRPGSMRQDACLIWTSLTVWYPAGIPQAGTLEVSWTVPARVFGSHV